MVWNGHMWPRFIVSSSSLSNTITESGTLLADTRPCLSSSAQYASCIAQQQRRSDQTHVNGGQLTVGKEKNKRTASG